MKGSKTVKKLALNEMLEALEEPQKEPVFFSVRKVARMGSFETRKYTHLTRHCALHCTNKKTWCFSSISGTLFLTVVDYKKREHFLPSSELAG